MHYINLLTYLLTSVLHKVTFAQSGVMSLSATPTEAKWQLKAFAFRVLSVIVLPSRSIIVPILVLLLEIRLLTYKKAPKLLLEIRRSSKAVCNWWY